MAHQTLDIGHLGSHPFNHQQSPDAEQEYDRLRDLARQEASKRSSCFDRAHQAYERGDGAAAHALSEEGKQHGAQMAAYNKQASDFIFRENNAESQVASDTIDLHGQYVEEAEDLLEARIRHVQSTGQSHLHVIVGKGNHSANHVPKIKTRVEKVCQELGLQYQAEANEGRIYILTGSSVDAPPSTHAGGTQYSGNPTYPGNQPSPAHNQHQGGHPHHEQHHHQGHPQRNQQVKKIAKKLLPKVIRKLEREVCVVM